MAKGDTKIKMTFETAGAAAANMTANSIYRNQTTGLRKVKQEATLLSGVMSKLGGVMAGMATVGGGVRVLNEYAQAAERTAAALETMERAVIPLSSLGSNSGNMVTMRNEVARLTAAADASAEDVAGALFNLQSTTGNLSESIRDELKAATLDLAEASGGKLNTAVDLMVKSYQIFGNEVENVTQLSNKLMYTQDKAAVTFDQLATRLPELAGAAGTVGVSMDEMMAVIIGATKKSGSVEKTFTGLRNVFLIMEEAAERGTFGTGPFLDRLKEMKKQFELNGAEMRDLFGKRAVVEAANMANSIDDITASFYGLQGVTGESSKAVEVIAQRLEDSVSRMVRINQANARFRENAPTLAEGTAPQTGAAKFKRRQDLGALGAQVTTGAPADSWSAWFGKWSTSLGSTYFEDKGRAVEIANTDPGPLRDVLIEESWKARRARNLRGMSMSFGPGGAPAIGLSSSVAQEYANLRNQEFAVGPNGTNPDGSGNALATQELNRLMQSFPQVFESIKGLLENIRDGVQNNQASQAKTKPGGSTTNYQEGT